METLIESYDQKMLHKSDQIESYCNCAGGYIYDLKGAIAVQRTLSTRQQLNLTLKRSSTSAYSQVNSDSDMLTIKTILNVMFMKMRLSFRHMFVT